jgi:hypothetical protein
LATPNLANGLNIWLVLAVIGQQMTTITTLICLATFGLTFSMAEVHQGHLKLKFGRMTEKLIPYFFHLLDLVGITMSFGKL